MLSNWETDVGFGSASHTRLSATDCKLVGKKGREEKGREEKGREEKRREEKGDGRRIEAERQK
jgi:hypothetical protein